MHEDFQVGGRRLGVQRNCHPESELLSQHDAVFERCPFTLQ
jgi:hypothetical protein